jgi:hypothetical protein
LTIITHWGDLIYIIHIELTMNFQNMGIDLFRLVFSFSNDECIIMFLSTCWALHMRKNEIIFKSGANMKDIKNLFYFNQFSIIHVSSPIQQIPLEATNVFLNTPYNSKFDFGSNSKITSIYIKSSAFDQCLKQCKFPPKIKELIISGGSSNNILVPGSIPDSVESIILYIYPKQNFVREIFPPLLKCLIFGHDFNQSIDNCLPLKLRRLQLGRGFNQSIHNLPQSLVNLSILSFYVIDISKLYLLTNLQTLTLGGIFNSSIDGYLPQSLTKLILGSGFDQKIVTPLPPLITHLTWPRAYYNYDLRTDPKVLPSSLTHLIIDNLDAHQNELASKKLPQSITYIQIFSSLSIKLEKVF